MTSILDRRQEGISKDPWYVRVILTLGPVAAIAMFLVYAMTETIGSSMREAAVALPRIEHKLDQHINETQQLQRTLERLASEQHEHGSRMENYARQQCVMLAETSEQRRDCLSVR